MTGFVLAHKSNHAFLLLLSMLQERVLSPSPQPLRPEADRASDLFGSLPIFKPARVLLADVLRASLACWCAR